MKDLVMERNSHLPQSGLGGHCLDSGRPASDVATYHSGGSGNKYLADSFKNSNDAAGYFYLDSEMVP